MAALEALLPTPLATAASLLLAQGALDNSHSHAFQAAAAAAALRVTGRNLAAALPLGMGPLEPKAVPCPPAPSLPLQLGALEAAATPLLPAAALPLGLGPLGCSATRLQPAAASAGAILSLALVFLPTTTLTHSSAVEVQHPAAALLLALEVPLAAAMPLVILTHCLEVLPPAALPLPLEYLLPGPLALLSPAAAAAAATLPLALVILPTAPAHPLELQHPAAALLLVVPPSAVVLLHSLEVLPSAALPLPLERVAGPFALCSQRETRRWTDRL